MDVGEGGLHKFTCLSPRESFFTAIRRVSTVGVRREAADLQQRLGRITSPHGVARNNHRCLSAGVEPASSFDLVTRAWYIRSKRLDRICFSSFKL